MTMTMRSTATTMTLYVSIPEGERIRGRVKEVLGTAADPEQVHPGKPHQWREMLHYGEPGTGFAHCLCGAMGIPYRRAKA